MTKIKLYIVTYNNDDILRQNLEKLYSSDLLQYDYKIYIINNYSKLKGFTEYSNLEILDNVLRPDFSNGHLARNWNEAIIHGFENLNNPDTDFVVTMQNDTFVKPTCFSNLIEYHNLYDFIQVGVGDQLMSFNVDAIKHIGLFDERFNSIGYQEADYFMTACVMHKSRTSINDGAHHGRQNNPIENIFDKFIEPVHHLNQQFHSWNWHKYNYQLFYNKWGCCAHDWSNLEEFPTEPKILRFFYYPYFEKDILHLQKHKYSHDIQ
jgi:hypothetical protein